MKEIVIRLVLFIIYILISNDHDYILGCGLFAFVGTEPDKYFNWLYFHILGIYNNDRGGDACGIMYDNNVMHGVNNKNNEYDDFIIANPMSPYMGTKPVTILGHCRKASSGGLKDHLAQPFVIRKRNVNPKLFKNYNKNSKVVRALKNFKDDDIIFAGIHNGTLKNHMELAKKYHIETEYKHKDETGQVTKVHMNDSQILLSILFYGYTEVLSEYIGNAAVVYTNKLNGTTCMFRGKSRPTNMSTEETEENPLFFIYLDKGQKNMYISSIMKPLQIIRENRSSDDHPVYQLIPNILIVMRDGVHVDNISIDRSKAYQHDYLVYDNRFKNVYSKPASYWYDTDYDNKLPFKYEHNYAKDTVSSVSTGDKDSNKKSSVYDASTRETLMTSIVFPADFFSTYNDIEELSDVVTGSNNSPRLLFEKPSILPHWSTRRAVFCKGRYWMNGHLMHGVYVLSPTGFVPTHTELVIDHSKVRLYYFVEGIMIDSSYNYDKCMEIHEQTLNSMTKVLYDESITSRRNPIERDSLIRDIEESFTKKIAMYSNYPVTPLLNFYGREKCFSNYCSIQSVKSVLDEEKIMYTGMFHPYFSTRDYRFDRGSLHCIREHGYGEIKEDTSNASYQYHIDKIESYYEMSRNVLLKTKQDNLLNFIANNRYYVGMVLVFNNDMLNISSPFEMKFNKMLNQMMCYDKLFEHLDRSDEIPVTMIFNTEHMRTMNPHVFNNTCITCSNEAYFCTKTIDCSFCIYNLIKPDVNGCVIFDPKCIKQ